MSWIEWVMMGMFAVAVAISVWKVYVFLPAKPLDDDDTTEAALEKLTELMLRCIVERYEHHEELTTSLLFDYMVNDPEFDSSHFWRFNPNKLNNLIVRYFAKHPHASSLEHIYHVEKARFSPRSHGQ